MYECYQSSVHQDNVRVPVNINFELFFSVLDELNASDENHIDSPLSNSQFIIFSKSIYILRKVDTILSFKLYDPLQTWKAYSSCLLIKNWVKLMLKMADGINEHSTQCHTEGTDHNNYCVKY